MTADAQGNLEARILAADGTLVVLRDRIIPELKKAFPKEKIETMPRMEINREIKNFALAFLSNKGSS